MQIQSAPASPTPARVRVRKEWTSAEKDVIQRKWPDMAELKRLLPHRTEIAIRWMAKKCGLIPEKEVHIWTAAEDKKSREWVKNGVSRKEIAARLGLTLHQVQCRFTYSGIRAPKLAPTPVRDPLANEIRKRAFEMKLTLRDLDLSLGRTHVFSRQCYSRKHASPKAIMKAVEALGGKLVIEWEALN